MDMLKFLEKSEWVVIHGCGDHGDECLECEEERPKHKPDCDLKATIDDLRSGRLVVMDKESMIGLCLGYCGVPNAGPGCPYYDDAAKRVSVYIKNPFYKEKVKE